MSLCLHLTTAAFVLCRGDAVIMVVWCGLCAFAPLFVCVLFVCWWLLVAVGVCLSCACPRHIVCVCFLFFVLVWFGFSSFCWQAKAQLSRAAAPPKSSLFDTAAPSAASHRSRRQQRVVGGSRGDRSAGTAGSDAGGGVRRGTGRPAATRHVGAPPLDSHSVDSGTASAGTHAVVEAAAATGDHLSYLESQYAALFGQDGTVTTALRGATNVLPAAAALAAAPVVDEGAALDDHHPSAVSEDDSDGCGGGGEAARHSAGDVGDAPVRSRAPPEAAASTHPSRTPAPARPPPPHTPQEQPQTVITAGSHTPAAPTAATATAATISTPAPPSPMTPSAEHMQRPLIGTPRGMPGLHNGHHRMGAAGAPPTGDAASSTHNGHAPGRDSNNNNVVVVASQNAEAVAAAEAATRHAQQQLTELRREISRLKHQHRSELNNEKMRHHAQLEAAELSPSASQTAEFRSLMDRFVKRCVVCLDVWVGE